MRRRGEVRDLGMLMAGVAVEAVLGWCSLVKLRISSEPRGAAAILRRVFHFYDCMASPNYRVTGQLESYILLQSIWGVKVLFPSHRINLIMYNESGHMEHK